MQIYSFDAFERKRSFAGALRLRWGERGWPNVRDQSPPARDDIRYLRHLRNFVSTGLFVNSRVNWYFQIRKSYRSSVPARNTSALLRRVSSRAKCNRQTNTARYVHIHMYSCSSCSLHRTTFY